MRSVDEGMIKHRHRPLRLRVRERGKFYNFFLRPLFAADMLTV